MKKSWLLVVWGTFVIIFTLLPFSAVAEMAFSDNPVSIEEAAKSVLMIEVYDFDMELVATGSGFVAFEPGMVVTNLHVIENGWHFFAYDDNGKEYELGYIYATDEIKDIALMCVLGENDLQPLDVNLYDDIYRGETIVAIGSPIGITNTVSIGNISAVYTENDVDYIQFTAPISSGSSGGALFNDRGQVLGITTATYTDAQNINLAIDIVEAYNLYEKNEEEPLRVGTLFATKHPRIYNLITGGDSTRGLFDILNEYGYVVESENYAIELGLVEFTRENSEYVNEHELFSEVSVELQELLYEGMPIVKAEPCNSVRMLKEAYVEYYISDDVLDINFELTNISPSRSVSSVELCLYYKENGTEKSEIFFREASVFMTPRSTEVSEYVSIPLDKNGILCGVEKFETIKLYCAVSKIIYQDGSIYEVQSEDLVYDRFDIMIY